MGILQRMEVLGLELLVTFGWWQEKQIMVTFVSRFRRLRHESVKIDLNRTMQDLLRVPVTWALKSRDGPAESWDLSLSLSVIDLSLYDLNNGAEFGSMRDSGDDGFNWKPSLLTGLPEGTVAEVRPQKTHREQDILKIGKHRREDASLIASNKTATEDNLLLAATDSYMTVSYTHLDVYKRQHWYLKLALWLVSGSLIYFHWLFS